jgi:hypothetical protein
LPSIPIYEAPDKEVAIPDRGPEALGSAARRLGTLGVEKAQLINKGAQDIQQGFERLGSGVDDLGKFQTTHEATQEMLNGNEAIAATNNTLTQQWQKLTSDPADLKNPTLAQDFLENTVRPAVEQVQSNFQTTEGQRWAADRSGVMLQHWGSIASADQARLAGINAVASTNQTMDHLTNAVNTDPVHLPLAIDQIKSTNAAIVASGSLPTDQGAGITGPGQDKQISQLIQVAAKAQIDANPNADMSGFYKTYGDRMGGEEVATFQRYQQQRQKMATVDAAGQQKQAAIKAQATSDQQAASYYPQIFGALNTGSHTLPADALGKIMHDPNLTPDTQTALVGAYAKITNGTAATSTNPDDLDDAVAGLLAPAGSKAKLTPTDIVNGVAKGQVSPHDANFLLSANPGQLNQLNDALTFGRSYLAPSDPGSGKVDPVKYNQYDQYQRWAINQASKGALPPMNQLPGVMPTFQAYTIQKNAAGQDYVSYGVPKPPESGLTKIFHSVFGGGKS